MVTPTSVYIRSSNIGDIWRYLRVKVHVDKPGEYTIVARGRFIATPTRYNHTKVIIQAEKWPSKSFIAGTELVRTPKTTFEKTLTFSTSDNTFILTFLWTNAGYGELFIDEIFIKPANETDKHTRLTTLESSIELFNYNGVYDEITSDGLVVKRWNRETVTVSSGSATLSKSGRGNAIVVAVSDGVPYDGTVSGTTLTTSASDGDYVVIYQLATPDIQKLDYFGELILYPGKNYLVTDSKTPIAISIKGAKKYLEG